MWHNRIVPTGRRHIVVCTFPSCQFADPQHQTHQWWYTSGQHPLRISGPHSPHWSSTRGASQLRQPHSRYTSSTSHLPTTSTSTGQARYCHGRIRYHVARWHSSLLREFLVLHASHRVREGQRLASMLRLQSAERPYLACYVTCKRQVCLLLHSNGDLRNSTVADQLLMFATCGRFPWKAPTDIM
jgi:hypothetical protein